jgi:hypothetical protein
MRDQRAIIIAGDVDSTEALRGLLEVNGHSVVTFDTMPRRCLTFQSTIPASSFLDIQMPLSGMSPFAFVAPGTQEGCRPLAGLSELFARVRAWSRSPDTAATSSTGSTGLGMCN